MRSLSTPMFSLCLLLIAAPAIANDIRLVTRSERAALAWDSSRVTVDGAGISADGRFVVYETNHPVNAQDLGTDDDVILHDRLSGEVILVSHAAGDPQLTGNGSSSDPVISADGSTVIFHSRATDLISGFVDSGSGSQYFAWDRATDTTRLISHTAGSQTTAGNDFVFGAVVSSDGAYVVFQSQATDHIAGTDTNNRSDVFRWTRADGGIELVSHIAASPTTTGNEQSSSPSVSADGRLVAFQSSAFDIAPSDTNGVGDIFLWDSATGDVTLVSESTAGAGITANQNSFFPRISADGSTIVFISQATDLVTGTDTPFSDDVFRWQVATGTVELLSHVAGDATTTGNGRSRDAAVSADGEVVVFESRATDLVAAADTPGNEDIFRWRAGGGVELLSTPDAGATASTGACVDPRVNDDGSAAVFVCQGSDLVPGTDNNGTSNDVFLWRDIDGAVTLVSRKDSDPASTGENGSSRAQISGDGGSVLFESGAEDLIAVGGPDTGAYVFEPASGELELVSRAPAVSTDLLTSDETGGFGPTISGDGRFIVFESNESRVIEGLTWNREQVYLYDRVLEEVTLVSHSTAGPLVAADRLCSDAAISDDGNSVVFLSRASDLVAGSTTNGQIQVYHWDRLTGTTRLVSHIPGDELTAGNSAGRDPVAGPGGTVFFTSGATDLAPGGDPNGFNRDIFMWEASTSNLRVVSRSAGDPTMTADNSSGSFSVSADGQSVAFESNATDLIPGFVGVPFTANIFLWDRGTGDVELVSRSTAGPLQGGDDFSVRPRISADGGAVAFTSRAEDLVAGFVPGFTEHIFHWHRSSGELRLVDHAAGAVANGADNRPNSPKPSADGELVAFTSRASNLVPAQVSDGRENVFTWARNTGDVTLISHSLTGPTTTANQASRNPSISADGERVIFESGATDLIPGFSGSGDEHVFLFDRTASTFRLIDCVACPTGAASTYGSEIEALSTDGSWLVLTSADSELTDGVDDEDSTDIYLASLDAPATVDLRLSLSSPSTLPLPPAVPFTLEATVDNQSVADSGQVYIRLGLPNTVDFLGFSGAGWTCDFYRGTLSCGGDPIAAGASSTLTLDLRSPAVAGPFSIPGSTLWNGTDPQKSDNVASFDAVVAPDDWGDAPDPGYPTLAASNGAGHGFSGLFLGAMVDVDVDGQPDAMAGGDDGDGSADEDGVTLPLLIRGQADTIDVVASGAGVLDAWIDWNGDGEWSTGEKIVDGQAVVAGNNTIMISTPTTASIGATFTRFRLSSAGIATPTGRAVDGEVEDHAVTIEARSDLAIIKMADPEPVIAGETLTYTLTVSNLGPSPSTGAVVSDPLPAGVVFLSSVDGCTETAGTVSCAITALASGSSQSTSFVVTVDPGQATTLTNTATVLGSEPDPALGNNTSPAVETTVISPSDVSGTLGVLGATESPMAFQPGDTVIYVATLLNTGPAVQIDNPGPEFSDTLPEGLTLRGATADSGVTTVDPATGTVEWNGSIAPDGMVVIDIEATVDYGTNGETLLNQGTISFDADGDGINESSVLTDDPDLGGAADPTPIRILTTVEIPTLDELGLLLLVLTLGVLAVRRLGAG